MHQQEILTSRPDLFQICEVYCQVSLTGIGSFRENPGPDTALASHKYLTTELCCFVDSISLILRRQTFCLIWQEKQLFARQCTAISGVELGTALSGVEIEKR